MNTILTGQLINGAIALVSALATIYVGFIIAKMKAQQEIQANQAAAEVRGVKATAQLAADKVDMVAVLAQIAAGKVEEVKATALLAAAKVDMVAVMAQVAAGKVEEVKTTAQLAAGKVEEVAQTTLLVKQTLEASTQDAATRLAEVAKSLEVARATSTTKLDEMAKVGVATHVLVNSRYGDLLKTIMLLTRRIASGSDDPRDAVIADEAERKSNGHAEKQAQVDSAQVIGGPA